MRWITAAAFLALLAWLMWAFQSFQARQIFEAFSVITFFYCLIIGTVRTADCLSSEKRDGTMGLLFLTNLNAPEIIGGKLCSSALAAAYALFAIFPLLALQMLVGGITLGHFWRTVLALGDAIFFSIAAGFLVSSVCLRQITAVASATGLALFFSAGLMGMAAVANIFRSSKMWVDALAIFSPLYTLVSADGGRVFGRNHYWWSVLAVTGLSGIWLALASWRVGRSWRDRPTGARAWSNSKILQRWRKRGHAARAALRRRLLGINPFFWLGGRGRVSAPVFMLLTVIIVTIASLIAAPFFGRVMPGGALGPMNGHLFAWFWAALMVHALVLYDAAMVASRRLAEDKQTGALELVLSTPTSERSISRGLWMAYGRRMFFPATVAILIHFFLLWQGATMAVLDPPATNLPARTTAGQLLWHALLDQPIRGAFLDWHFILVMRVGLLSLVLFILIWITLGWLGRWLGLRMKHAGFAPAVSLALVFVPPIVLFSLAVFCVNQSHLNRLPDRMLVPLMMWVAFGLEAAQCLILSGWAAGRLRRDFRAVVTSQFQPSFRTWWRPGWRRVLRFGIGCVAVGIALSIIVFSFYGYQNWRSRRAWSRFKNELKQRHQTLEVAALLPAPASDSQNFALTPAFRNWAHPAPNLAATNGSFGEVSIGPANYIPGVEWIEQGFAPLDEYVTRFAPKTALPGKPARADFALALLKSLEAQEPTLRELATAARLPYFQTFTKRNALAVLLPDETENGALERLHLLWQARACALLVTARNAEAAEDLMSGLQLVRLARQIPDTQSSMRAQVFLVRSLQPLWEGIIGQLWTEPQLATFQTELGRFNLLGDYTNAVRRVVLAHIETWQGFADRKNAAMRPLPGQRDIDYSAWQMQPRAWWLENCRQLYQAGKAVIEKVDVARGHVNFGASWADLNGLPLDEETTLLLQQAEWTGPSPQGFVFAQTAVNQAIIACALERHRLALGRYPERLDQLVPEYLPTTPNDIVRGSPMLYENTGDGRFILRSVGPNQKDDRNKPVSDDWLWSFPTNAPAAAVPK